MEALIANSLSRPRFYTVLLASFAGIAVILAGVGLYGVIAYLAARRTKEIGIRRALGATLADVLRLFLRQAATVTGIGILVGVFLAAALTQYLRAMLFGVDALDGATFVAVCLAFVTIAIAAALVPAHRAAQVEPAVSLRLD
jgi:putative ABC transport system permease protein